MFGHGSTLASEWMTPGIPGLEPDPDSPEAVLDAAAPGPDLAAAIAGLAPIVASLGGAGREAMLEAVRRQEAYLAAVKLQAIDGLTMYWADRPTNRDRRLPDDQAAKFAAGSVGAALRLPYESARGLVDLAGRLTEDFPTTLEWLQAGVIDAAHARVIAEELSITELGEEFRADLEAGLLEAAPGGTARELRKLALKWIAEADPAAARRRRRARTAERKVVTRDEGDGIASLTWTDEASRIHDARERLQELSEAQAPGDERSAHQRRADAAADLFGVGPRTTDQVEAEPEEDRPPFPFDPAHDSAREGFEADSRYRFDPHAHPADHATGEADHATGGQGEHHFTGPDSGQGDCSPEHAECPECADGAIPTPGGGGQGAGKVAVHVDLLTLQRMRAGALETRDGAVYFEGVGWIDTELAQALLRTAGKVEVVVTDLEGQCIYSSEDQQYVPRAWQERTVEHAHQVCRFPGCRRPARRCDLDHREEHATGGATCPHNLQPLCRTHHNLKTHGGWTVQPLDPLRPSGDLIWTSPFGRRSLDRLEEPLFIPRQRRGFGGDREDPPF